MSASSWELEGFIQHLDDWILLESPDDDLRRRVTGWILGLSVDPFRDAKREV